MVQTKNEISLRHLRHKGGKGGTGRHLGLQEAMGLQEAPKHKNRCVSQLECKSVIKMLILHIVCEGQITKYCKLQARMLPGVDARLHCFQSFLKA